MPKSAAWPRPGNQLPQWPRPISWLAQRLLSWRGWRLVGEIPNQPKQVLAAAPHTSNWDWAVGIMFVFALGVRIHWLGKHTLFRWPYNYFFRPLGGIPVDRKAAKDIVSQVTEVFNARQKFVLAIAPEGTRQQVDRFKTGFYRIAQQAQVPISLAFIDLANKEIGFLNCPALSGNMERDIALIEDAYQPLLKRLARDD